MAGQARKREKTRELAMKMIPAFKRGIRFYEENGKTADAARVRKLVEDLKDALDGADTGRGNHENRHG